MDYRNLSSIPEDSHYNRFFLLDSVFYDTPNKMPLIELVRNSLKHDCWSECLLGLDVNWSMGDVTRAFGLLNVILGFLWVCKRYH